MTITLRSVKGSALTHGELDGNFTDLNGRTLSPEVVAALPEISSLDQTLDFLPFRDASTGLMSKARPTWVYVPEVDPGDFSNPPTNGPFVVSPSYNQERIFTGAQNHIIEFPSGLPTAPHAYGLFTAPANNTLTLRRAPDSGVSINGVASNTFTWVVPVGGSVEWKVVAFNTIRLRGDTTGEIALTGPLNLSGKTIIPGAPVVVSGARTYGATDSGKNFRVDVAGTQAIPPALGSGWRVAILNNTASSFTIDGPTADTTLGSGEVCEVMFWSSAIIKVARGDTVGI